MDASKLARIIERKNEQLEDNTVRQAELIIEGIVRRQKDIAKANEEITELRAELAALEVPQLDPATILT